MDFLKTKNLIIARSHGRKNTPKLTKSHKISETSQSASEAPQWGVCYRLLPSPPPRQVGFKHFFKNIFSQKNIIKKKTFKKDTHPIENHRHPSLSLSFKTFKKLYSQCIIIPFKPIGRFFYVKNQTKPQILKIYIFPSNPYIFLPQFNG